MDKTLQDAISVANHHGLTDRELATVVEAATAARRAEAERPGLVTIIHPGLPERYVDPEAALVYAESGWRVKATDVPAADAPAESDAKTKTTAKSKKDE